MIIESKDDNLFALDAERAILGSIFLDSGHHEKIFEELKSDYFQDSKNALLFEFCSLIYSKGASIDILIVTTELKKAGRLKEVGGSRYISELVASVPVLSNVDKYIDIVKDIGIRKNLIKLSSYISNSSADFSKTTDEIFESIEKTVFSIVKNSFGVDYYDAATLVEMQIKKADELAKNPDGLRGISVGISSVDKMLGGLHSSDLIIVAARPSVGKSAFVFDLGRHVGVNEKKSVLIFSLEMPAIQVIERMLAQQAEIDLWNIRLGKLSDRDYKKFAEGMSQVSRSSIYVDDTASVTLQNVRSKARKLKMEKGLDLIIIDYLQLMQTPGKSDNRAFEIGEISRSLKILARELNIPIVVLSQLNRAVETRQEKIPQLSDLRESGSIEQDADVVIFLGRDIAAEVNDDKSSIVDIFVAKHRNGPTGRFKLKFNGSSQKFYDIIE